MEKATALINLDSDIVKHLRWEEKSRYGPKTYFGMEEHEELPEDLLKDIPEDIGEAFQYRIGDDERAVIFSREFYNSMPLTAMLYLSFHFGMAEVNKANAARNPFAFMEGFEYLRARKMIFSSGFFGDTGKPYVDFEEQNLGGLRAPGNWVERAEFSDLGERVVESLISNIPNIMIIPGMRPEDHSRLFGLLMLIEEKYRSGKISHLNV